MIEQFLHFTIIFAGATVGILAVVIPISIVLFIGWELYEQHQAKRWKKMADAYIEEQLKAAQGDEPSEPDLRNTDSWV